MVVNIRKVVLLIGIILLIITISDSVFAQQVSSSSCQLATPRYGSVRCNTEGVNERIPINFISSDTYSAASFACLSDCQLDPTDVVISCDYSVGGWKAEVNGIIKYSTGIFGVTTGSIDWVWGDSFVLTANCRGADFWTTHPVKSTSSASIKQTKIMLEEAWAGSLNYVPISGTEGCSIQKVIDNYKGQVDVNSFLNPVSGNVESKPSSKYTSTNQMPINWNIGDTYIFVKDWQTGIADISLTYDKSNNAYWCGGQFGSRKIYNVNQITSASGSCYAIPQTIALSNIQCCFASDCLALDPSGRLTCDPTTWSCKETKPCNSNIDCEQTFSSGVCQNKQSTSWGCDTTQKWGNYAGTCVKSTRNVEQCSSDCTANEYYNDQQGKCLSKVVLVQCPAGKCCKSGGNYVEKSCDGGLQCCINNDPMVGDCKTSCVTSTTQSSQFAPETSSTTTNEPSAGLSFNLNANTGIVIIGIIVLASVIGFLVWKKKLHIPPTKKEINTKPKDETSKKYQHCTHCGAKQESGKKFCTGCGKKLKG
ncbi:MAG: hypothetical protein WA139_01485 [Candidatus Aenigmatarchaeota archaeon]